MREVLRTIIPMGSVHTIVTSPPYWGLRDYGIPPSVWGEEDWATTHEHGTKIAAMNPAFREQVREKMRPIWDNWAEEIGPPAPELLQRVDKFHAKWIESR